MSPLSRSRGGSYAPGVQLTLLAIVTLAFVGFFTGVGRWGADTADPLRWPVHRRPVTGAAAAADRMVGDHAALPAVSYLEMPSAKRGPNRAFVSDLASLVAVPLPEAERADPQLRAASLVARAQRRAYNGAPPVIPHPVDTVDASSCLACHERGLAVGDRVASRIPHPHLVNCLQCHAESLPAVPGGPAAPLASDFAGMSAPSGGPRAFAAAPPQIPHSTWMRQDCLACHGPTGMPGLQTTHPERRNCKQCHAPSAVLEQAPGVDR